MEKTENSEYKIVRVGIKLTYLRKGKKHRMIGAEQERLRSF